MQAEGNAPVEYVRSIWTERSELPEYKGYGDLCGQGHSKDEQKGNLPLEKFCKVSVLNEKFLN